MNKSINITKLKIKRPLTQKEKVLLIIMLVILSSYLLFIFVYSPQKEMIQRLEDHRIELDDKIAENNRILRSENDIKDEWEKLNLERDGIIKDFFSTMDQSQIIYLLNNLLVSDDLASIDLNFSKATIENIKDHQVKSMDVNLPFKGGYDGIFDIIRAIELSPKKIVISSIDLNSRETDLTGNMNLKIYSLDGLTDSHKDEIFVDSSDGNMDNPFKAMDGYKDPNKNQEGGDENSSTRPDNWVDSPNEDHTELVNPNLIYDFEMGSYEFFSSNPMFGGRISDSTMAKEGNYSLKFDYSILASNKANRGYIDLASNKIIIESPIRELSLWVYSSSQNDGAIDIVFTDKNNEEITINIIDEISWEKWKAHKINLPTEKSRYPLHLENISLFFPKGNELFGSFLFDKLEIHSEYFYYKVKPGDTVSGISKKVYGSAVYVNEILKLNEMKQKDILQVGRELKLKIRE